MIKANELRIGNYVYQSLTDMTEDVCQEIKTIGATHVSTHELNEVVPFDKLEGIPLMNELLEKCGFKLNSKGLFDYYAKYFNQTDTKGCQQKSKFSLGRNGTEVFINDRWLCGIDYLHQLQNLYFSITGEELEISL